MALDPVPRSAPDQGAGRANRAGRGRRPPLSLPFARPALAMLIPPLIALLVVAVAVEIWVRVGDVSIYLLPRPSAVFEEFFGDFGRYFGQGMQTLGVSLGGLVIGTIGAVLFAAAVAHSPLLERSLLPIAIMVKVTPVVAVIPILIIWLGYGWEPKVAITALITYFPVLINAISGFRDLDPRVLDFFRSVNASTWETLLRLRLPAAIPYLFAALKISVTLSLIGAVVAEFFVARETGLGSVIRLDYDLLNLPGVFAAVLMLTLLGVSLSSAVAGLERLASWSPHSGPSA